ncbi:aspartate-semialdehyde dehydrogenase [Candidatus Nitronereus thalassa]|uniref:Aspartate-semialdehyde dehydrogenase n=1 Tax=Candidatus Nitronereus thalassa TaxID=3020898 RepID=A0ABU3K7N9_9BACT|nr:aspartate-semialdehyde dehydrogenase [Candidatus Nitronereus thalassa]MDT7042409.1 aspartate-semialdehyde dehydrogenase [Candidatus Nitronereus thalassa]
MNKKSAYTVAVVGATGAVGTEMLSVLEERKFPVDHILPLASSKSAGEEVTFQGKDLVVKLLTKDSFQGVDIALFSAGGDVSKEYAPIAAKAGAVVIDNSSAWRMDPQVPLVVPEVNPQDISKHQGIIANPNCSTIQMVVALKPLHDHAKITRIVVSTYQSVSGTGKEAMDELAEQCRQLLTFGDINPKVYPHQIAFNCLPHIDDFLPSGYTKEEMKMVNETRKIMGEPTIGVSATTVRVPVFVSHAESINIETEKKLSVEEARAILSTAPGVQLFDDPSRGIYPLQLDAVGTDAVFVGRIREDDSIPKGLNLWVVADNLRKGAALNAVQIAEELVR